MVKRIRQHWPKTHIVIRGDGHYGRDEAMSWCEDNGVDYIFGFGGNAVLDRLVEVEADDTLSALLDVSWNQLLDKQTVNALSTAERGLAVDEKDFQLLSVKAHALMLLGRGETARTLYLKYKDQKDAGGVLWDGIILNDFGELEKLGLTNPLVAEIKPQLAAPPPAGHD